MGIAITVLLCATVAWDRLPWRRRPAAPVIAVGTMSLTLYVGHILAILALPGGWAPREAERRLHGSYPRPVFSSHPAGVDPTVAGCAENGRAPRLAA